MPTPMPSPPEPRTLPGGHERSQEHLPSCPVEPTPYGDDSRRFGPGMPWNR